MNDPFANPAGDEPAWLGTADQVRRAVSSVFGPESAEPIETDSAAPAIEGFSRLEAIGSGGGGTVYRAIRDSDRLKVAVKVLHHCLGAGPDARRLWRELDLLADIRHPSIPRVLGHGTLADARPYIVFEYVSGKPLDKHAAESGASIAGRVGLIAAVADAVQALHDRGVIHRDIKPSNVLIDAHGVPIVIDLGVASLIDGTALETLTADGVPLGTPAFMAPEQARGERHRITTRSDVYALGATAYAILTGSTPHDMNTTIHEAIRRVAFDLPRSARELNPTLDASLDAVLLKAVAPNPDDRYASPAAFAIDLRRWLNNEPVEARPPNLWQRAARWAARHPVRTVAAAALTIGSAIIALSLLGAWWLGAVPYRVKWSGDPYQPAVLVTRTGLPLHEWPASESRGRLLTFAGTLRRAGASDLAVIAENWESGGPYAGLLCAYRFDDYENEPLWVRGVESADLSQPNGLRGSPPEEFATNGINTSFTVHSVIIADIFPDRPGAEIVAAHVHQPWSANAIRVYDNTGAVLYEAWHDGTVGGFQWLPKDRLLICLALNSERLPGGEGGWSARGHPEANDAHPRVLFAIAPIQERTDQLLTSATCPDRFRPVWYKVLWPPELHRFLGTPVFTLPTRSRTVELEISDARPAASRRRPLTNNTARPGICAIEVDAKGHIVSRFCSDEYREDPAFPLDAIELRDLPPLVQPAKAGQH